MNNLRFIEVSISGIIRLRFSFGFVLARNSAQQSQSCKDTVLPVYYGMREKTGLNLSTITYRLIQYIMYASN